VARLPQVGRAILDIRKIEAYCLDAAHPRGRHKARVFRDAIGIGQRESGWLREAILDGIRDCEATEIAVDDFGSRWRADVPVTRHDKNVVVRTIWIVLRGDDVPRFVTCWVL
jgi:hypothetical protein